MKETRLCLNVAVYGECRSFYENVLQWPVHVEWDRAPLDQGVVYQVDNAFLELLHSRPEAATRCDRSFYLYVEMECLASQRNLWDRLTEQGFPPTPITSYNWGHTSFSVRDPAGFMLKFYVKNSGAGWPPKS